MDQSAAAYYYSLSAEQGNPAAQVDLASLLLNGNGVEKNLELAGQYYALAARQGHPYGLVMAMELGAWQ
jgi:TPR repeat protein